MPRLNYTLAILTAVTLASTALGKPYRRPFNAPSFPVSAETVSVGTDGFCLGEGWHNPNETRVTVFGLSPTGLAVQQPPYDTQVPWTMAEGCRPAQGWSAAAGVQYGQRISDDAANQYAVATYHVDMGSWRLTLLAGAVYRGLNMYRAKQPYTAQWNQVFPFALAEFEERF